MEKFADIHQRAAKHYGGKKALAELMPEVRTKRMLAATRDNRWLSQMARCLFQAGFVWRVVNNKWDGFEEVFFGFPPEKIVMLSPDQIDRFSQNTLIIRNRQKVIAVQDNARFLCQVASEQGSFGKMVSKWPQDDLIGLFAYMKKHGSRLGGMTGPRVLRNMGKDTFLITGDVARCLQNAGLDIKDNPSSQREMRLIQGAFDQWHEETGFKYSHLSRIGACSV
ncbi:MAG: 3-methyladenine DNA glycosylase Tag [Halieaceae bacterium]|jgi:3-methyladenine DNA glycosylase Tag